MLPKRNKAALEYKMDHTDHRCSSDSAQIDKIEMFFWFPSQLTWFLVRNFEKFLSFCIQNAAMLHVSICRTTRSVLVAARERKSGKLRFPEIISALGGLVPIHEDLLKFEILTKVELCTA